MAFSPASSFAPADRITCRTVGRAVGIAAMASAIAVMNRRVGRLAPRQAQREHHDHRAERGGADPQGQRVQLLGQRRLLLGGATPACRRSCRPGRRAPTRGHQHHAAAVRDRRVHERHVHLVARARARRRRARSVSFDAGVLSPVRADSSMSSELACDDPAVGGHVVAGGEQHQVADDDLLGRDRRLDPVATHPRGLLRQRLQRVHRALGLALLAQADHGVDHRQQDQHGTGAPLADGERHHGGDEQDDLHVAAVLVEEAPPPRHRLLGRERVGPVLLQPLGGRRRGQAARRDRRRVAGRPLRAPARATCVAPADVAG